MRKSIKRFKRWMAFDPPGALTSKGWRLFNKEFKEKAPIRHFFYMDFRKKYVWPIKWKIQAVCDWVRYRTFDRYHIVDTKLKPGYYEIETLMLHSSFNMLKDFVEVELAWRTYWLDRDVKKSFFERHLPFYYFFNPFHKPEYGIKHLEWASTLDNPSLPLHERCDSQAVSARETLALYYWWTKERPSRKEVKIHHPKRQDDIHIFDEDYNRETEDYKKFMEDSDAFEKQKEDWANEDEEMMIRLIKIRRSLWS